MELQARQTAVTTAGPLGPNPYTGLSSCVSINTAVALKVGRHRVSYQPAIARVVEGPNARQRLVLRIDGKETALVPEIPLASGGRIVRTITPAFWQHHQVWYMNIDVQHARATEGVMGSIASGNWLPALPDGTLLGPRPASLAQRYQDLYEKFADAWRVTDPTSLFDYEPGLSTAAFTVDAWPMAASGACAAPAQPGLPQVSAAKPLTPAEAEKVCAAIAAPDRRANCVADVTATGDPGFAETYLTTERLENKPIPAAPTLGLPSDNADLPKAVSFRWARAVDAAGGPISYRHCVWNADQLFDFNKCVAVGDEPPAGRGLFNVSLVLVIGLLLFLALLVSRLRHRRLALAIVALLIIPAVFLALYFGRPRVDATIASTSVNQLQAGKVYFWKVIAENGQGGVVESQTRRFTVR
jgi:hypothetical protein